MDPCDARASVADVNYFLPPTTATSFRSGQQASRRRRAAAQALPPNLYLCEPIEDLTWRRPDMYQQRSENAHPGRLRDMLISPPKHGTRTWSILFLASGPAVDGAYRQNMP
jgi:hypothetical protein